MATAVMLAVVAVVTVLLVLLPAAHAALYKVGDSTGWTTIGNPDYKQWAATKTFRLDDVILFQYNPQFHNVMQVTHEGYKTCNASSPITTHTTGNDTITVTRHGHYFFLCGVPGHCASGQKVDIHVRRVATSSAAPSLSPSPSVSSSLGKPSAMAPGPSSAAALSKPLKGLLSVVAAATVGCLCF